MRERLEWKDFAILYRTNAQSRIFEEMLRKRNIPYKVFGGQSFYERKEVRDLIAYLRMVVNPDDEEALKRIINYPRRGIGDTTVQKLTELARSLDVSIWSIISSPELSMTYLTPALRSKIAVFTGLMLPVMATAETVTAYDMADRMAAASGMITDLRQGQVPEEIDRLENIQELLNGIREFTDAAVNNGEPADVATWLQTVSLLTDQDMEKPEDKNKVALMTIHSAKGLEFKYVYIVGLEENLFPSNMNLYNPRELEEERRLFYVALTRACRRVTLSYALNRYKWGSLERSAPSRFIGEIENDFLHYPQSGGRPFRNAGRPDDHTFRERNEAFAGTPAEKKLTQMKKTAAFTVSASTAAILELAPGDRVSHERFGTGKVISVEGESPNTTALIEFETSGSKKLLLRFAKLTKM
jgi:DNA helicase II / ATP-dependent DNA helicase PcrA